VTSLGTPSLPRLSPASVILTWTASADRELVNLPINCQPSEQEEISKATMNQDHSGSRVVVGLKNQEESGLDRKSQDAVLILENRCPKGLVGSSPTPSAPSDLGFRVGITHARRPLLPSLSTDCQRLLVTFFDRKCSPEGVAKRTFGTLLEPCRVGRGAGAFEDHKLD
jgi:hypothetical protein